MKVTSIKQQVHKTDTYSIYVDNAYFGSLSATALLNSHLVVGQELNAEELKSLKQQSADDKLYNDTLRYIALRPRTEWEISTYLERKGSPPPLQAEILNKLSELKLVDDTDFAKRWIANRRLLKPTSQIKLIYELRTKHVAEEIIEEVLHSAESQDKAALREVIARKRLQTKYKDKEKLLRYLSSQGYRYEDIKEVLSEEET